MTQSHDEALRLAQEIPRFSVFTGAVAETFDPQTGKPSGAYVRASDYDALRSEVERLRDVSKPFIYKLNAMEHAAQQANPAEHDYKGKREAVLAHVAAASALAAQRGEELAQAQRIAKEHATEVVRLNKYIAAMKESAK